MHPSGHGQASSGSSTADTEVIEVSSNSSQISSAKQKGKDAAMQEELTFRAAR